MPLKNVSHYEIERQIGAGGMGEVYLARDIRLDRMVALKFLPGHLSHDSMARERLLREAKAASKLSHPNILTIHEVGDDAEGNVFIAMAYVEGDTLDTIISGGELPLDKLLSIAVQIGEGMAQAHSCGVVHRDIKPQNVLIDKSGRVTIFDFGLAKVFDTAKLTQTGALVGTMSYMSPEQARGLEVDHRTDIFSFGAVLYEMITGRSPFGGDNPATVLLGIMNDQPVPPSRINEHCPSWLDDVVLTALAKQPENRYQDVTEMLDHLQRERIALIHSQSDPDASHVVRHAPRRRRLPRYLALTSVLGAAVVAMLVFNPFRLTLISDQEAHADRNTLAVMYFDSIVDPEDRDRMAQMMTNLIITDLSESDALTVVSRQRLFDILKKLGHAGTQVIDRTVASDVAKEAGASWILTGSILQATPFLVLTSSVSDAESGRILSSQHVEGEPGEDLFSVVDRLGAVIRDDLAPTSEATRGTNRRLVDLTTHSERAYKSYLAGIDLHEQLNFVESAKAFTTAIELDSTFAMAYYRLSRVERLRMRFPEANRAAATAARFADHATPLERLFIECERATADGEPNRAMEVYNEIIKRYPGEKEAFTLLANMYLIRRQGSAAAPLYEKALALDPSYKIALNNLVYAYEQADNYDKAIETINRYIAMAPDEPNPYDTRGDLYAGHGRSQEAMASYRAAIERKADYAPSIAKLGHLHLFAREYNEADSVYRRFFGSAVPEDHAAGRALLALIPMAQGKLNEALTVIEQGIAADAFERIDPFHAAEKHFMRAEIYAALGQPKKALEACADGVRLVDASGVKSRYLHRARYIDYLAAAGQMKAAEDSLRSLEAAIKSNDSTRVYIQYYAAGRLAYIKGDYAEAVRLFNDLEIPAHLYVGKFEFANACFSAGQLGEATVMLKELQESSCEWKASAILMSVRSHYLLARAYEQSGWKDEALTQYREFLAYWDKGDANLTEVRDARARMVRLQTQT